MLSFTIGYWLRSAIPFAGAYGWALWLLSIEAIWKEGDHRVRVRFLGFTLSIELVTRIGQENMRKPTVKLTDGLKFDEKGEEIPVPEGDDYIKWAVKIAESGVKFIVRNLDLYDTKDNSFVLVIPNEAPVHIEIGTRVVFGGPDEALFVDVTGYRTEENVDEATKVRFYGKVVTF